MKELILIALFVFLLKAKAQTEWDDKRFFVLGSAENGVCVYDNAAGSKFDPGVSAKMYAAGFNLSTRYYFSPLTDFGPLHNFFVGAGYCTPLKFKIAWFFELGSSYTKRTISNEKGFGYQCHGPALISGLYFHPFLDNKFLFSGLARIIHYDIVDSRGLLPGFSANISVGVAYKIY